MKVKVSEM